MWKTTLQIDDGESLFFLLEKEGNPLFFITESLDEIRIEVLALASFFGVRAKDEKT